MRMPLARMPLALPIDLARWAFAALLLPGAIAECEIALNATRTEICEYVRDPANECRGEGWFPFLECFYCWVGGGAGAAGAFAAFFLWMVLLLYVLATTADMYFAPATEQLSDVLGLRPRVAGVTLLALGNGAPDVFSVMAAYRAGQGDLAVGALVGGSMFVTTVVVGAVITASGGSVKATGMFVRDIAFNLGGSTILFFFCLSERATLWEAIGLFVLYIIYVLAVTQGHKIPPMLREDRAEWYAAKERAAAAAASGTPSETTPLLDDLRASAESAESTSSGVLGGAPAEEDRERRSSIQGGIYDPSLLGEAPVVVKPEESGADIQREQLDCWGRFSRRMANATEWEELSRLERISFCFEAVMHFLRGLTIPPIPEDEELSGTKWDNAFQRVRAVAAVPGFCAWMALYVERRLSDVEEQGEGTDPPSGGGASFVFVGGIPLALFVLMVMLVWCPTVWLLTTEGTSTATDRPFVVRR